MISRRFLRKIAAGIVVLAVFAAWVITSVRDEPCFTDTCVGCTLDCLDGAP